MQLMWEAAQKGFMSLPLSVTKGFHQIVSKVTSSKAPDGPEFHLFSIYLVN